MWRARPLDVPKACVMLRLKMSRKTRAVALAAIGAFGIAGLSAIFFWLNRGPGYPPLPNPNGYDDFVRAGYALTGDVSGYSSMDVTSLKELIESNAEAIRLTSLGLTRRCSFPTELGITNLNIAMKGLPKQKALAQLLRAQGRLAELENHEGEAARDYVEGLRFGNEISHGGFVINRLVGIACEAISAVSLVKLMSSLNCEGARPLLAQLEQMDRDRVPFEEVRRLEKQYAVHELMKMRNPVEIVSGLWQARTMLQESENRHNVAVAHERLILIELALKCYQADHGTSPTNLNQLVPNYLEKVPSDPFGVEGFHYKPQGTLWLVYSVGPDGVDDGGTPWSRGSNNKGDLLYDSAW